MTIETSLTNITNQTYHNYQQVWQVSGESKANRFKKPRKASPRSSNGCLSCKRRRKKCDEEKPSCKGCTRNSLQCIWPKRVVKLLGLQDNRDYEEQGNMKIVDPMSSPVTVPAAETDTDNTLNTHFLKGTTVSQTRNVKKEQTSKCPRSSTTSTLEPQRATLQSDTPESLDKESELFDFDNFLNELSLDSNLNFLELSNSESLLDQLLFIQSENQAKFNSPGKSSTTSSSQLTRIADREFRSEQITDEIYDIPGVKMTEYDKVCYSHFIDKFILTITPPNCNPLLTPTKILLPYLMLNSTVREIFLTCGASFHSFKDDSYAKRVKERYTNCVNLLIEETQNSNHGSEDHLFIAAQLLQTLCLRDKNIGLNATKCAAHLSVSYEILKKRFVRNSNKLRNFSITPLDRLLSEHFVFNYPVTILWCHSDKLFERIIPSPFQFFEQFNDILNQPFGLDNDDPWLNHPILGVSLKAQEISAKCSWICRFFRKSMDCSDDKESLRQRYRGISMQLKEECEKNIEELRELSRRPDLKRTEKLDISLSITIDYAALMILKKLVFDITLPSNELRDENKLDISQESLDIKSEIKLSYQFADVPFVDVWCIFICGVLTADRELMKIIAESLTAVANWNYSSIYLKALKFLKMFWEEEHRDGVDVLFDTTILDIIM